MTDGPYVGGPIAGYRVAAFQLAPLLGGYEYTNVDSGSIDFFAPPDGTYHVVLTLEEFDGSNFVIVDWDNLTTLATFGLVPPTPTTTTTTTTSPTIATTSTLPSRIPRGPVSVGLYARDQGLPCELRRAWAQEVSDAVPAQGGPILQGHGLVLLVHGRSCRDVCRLFRVDGRESARTVRYKRISPLSSPCCSRALTSVHGE